MKVVALSVSLLGILALFYISFPLLSWQVYFVPVFASQNIAAPIPKTTIVSQSTLKSLLTQAGSTLKGVDYTNAQNWFPTYDTSTHQKTTSIASYKLSIPKLTIKDAIVSTVDNDLSIHLVNYAGTGIPPQKGNAVIFGHSTLPQLFNSKDYKTIFATAHTLRIGDEVIAEVEGVMYKYRIFNISVVDPEDTSIFTQTYEDSYLTLVTCTPPGTTWKRLILKSRLEKI